MLEIKYVARWYSSLNGYREAQLDCLRKCPLWRWQFSRSFSYSKASCSAIQPFHAMAEIGSMQPASFFGPSVSF
jgi:hypothetical protein